MSAPTQIKYHGRAYRLAGRERGDWHLSASELRKLGFQWRTRNAIRGHFIPGPPRGAWEAEGVDYLGHVQTYTLLENSHQLYEYRPELIDRAKWDASFGSKADGVWPTQMETHDERYGPNSSGTMTWPLRDHESFVAWWTRSIRKPTVTKQGATMSREAPPTIKYQGQLYKRASMDSEKRAGVWPGVSLARKPSTIQQSDKLFSLFEKYGVVFHEDVEEDSTLLTALTKGATFTADWIEFGKTGHSSPSIFAVGVEIGRQTKGTLWYEQVDSGRLFVFFAAPTEEAAVAQAKKVLDQAKKK